jgi:hypothetical protein
MTRSASTCSRDQRHQNRDTLHSDRGFLYKSYHHHYFVFQKTEEYNCARKGVLMTTSPVPNKIIRVCVLALQENKESLARDLNPCSADPQIRLVDFISAQYLIVNSLGAVEVLLAQKKGMLVILLAWQYHEEKRESDPVHQRFKGSIGELRELIIRLDAEAHAVEATTVLLPVDVPEALQPLPA